ncbi:glutathione S-transferase family protein [Bradyrhizobium sp. G127]|jgi:glutathione S-transferase|uniref:glutathione S-transferase family protein n=1 Tax=Bradyrhizobium sp. G127 TaxID=2904800 RepID=UPI001F282B71|nr:glutathione S-transferase family protein [Bradyrhizobium sp. G127]MCF2524550.1 glutathione S-transferase family protein [Bradyrhizobium sp. G127]
MLTLFHCASARSFRPLWALEEIGIPYELKMLPFPPRFLKREYLELNPLGTIPLLIDGDTRMTESSAICLYLVTKYGPTPLNVAVDEPAYGAYLNWLFFGEATLTFPQTIYFRYAQLEPDEKKNPQAAADYARWFLARLRALETAVSQSDWVCAGRFTAADISVGYALMFAQSNGLSAQFSPAVAAYWERLKNREGFRKAIAAQDRAGAEQGVAARVPAAT